MKILAKIWEKIKYVIEFNDNFIVSFMQLVFIPGTLLASIAYGVHLIVIGSIAEGCLLLFVAVIVLAFVLCELSTLKELIDEIAEEERIRSQNK